MHSAPLPKGSGLPFPIVRARKNSPLDVVLTSREYFGVMTHWNGKTTVWCHMPRRCKHCDELLARRWIGWITATSVRTGMSGLVQFTPPIARSMLENQTSGGDLLGMICQIRRNGPRVNSPLGFTFKGFDDQPVEVDSNRLEAVVEQIFQLDAFEPGV